MASTLNRENATCRWLSDLARAAVAQSANRLLMTQQNDEQFSAASSSSTVSESSNGSNNNNDDGDDIVFPQQQQQQQFCWPNFDKSLCWYNVSLGSTGHRPCPFAFCSTVPGCDLVQQTYRANRYCYGNGTWGDSQYGECIDLLQEHPQCVVGYCRTCPDPLRDTVISVSFSLSIVSVCVLLAALVLFSAFDSVQCRRLSIHKNLSAAFVLRFAVLAIWNVANSQNLFRDCQQFVPVPIRQWEWACKFILFGVIYFQVASVMWMLIEGIYLYSRFTVLAMRRSELPYAFYLATGWGLPFAVVLLWAIVHERQSQRLGRSSFCWLPYAQGSHLWILAGTMGMALVLNVLLLLAIVLILVQKLRSESTAESKKIWRTVKATMLLVPLLGVSNVPLFYEPSKPSAFYMLGSAILQHSQGIFIAVLYCFLNTEIRNALKRQLSKLPLLRTIGCFRHPNRGGRHFETERTLLPPQTTCGFDEDSRLQHVAMHDLMGDKARNGTAAASGGNNKRWLRRSGAKTVQSNSLTTGLNTHAVNDGSAPQQQQHVGTERRVAGSDGDARITTTAGTTMTTTTTLMSTSCGPLMDLAVDGAGSGGTAAPILADHPSGINGVE